MKTTLKPIPVLLVILTGLLVYPLAAAEKKSPIPTGFWQIAETFDNSAGKQQVIWSFELVDDGTTTLIAIGKRIEANGEQVQDRSVAIMFLDVFKDGSFGGSYIEAYGDGQQNELNLDVQLSDDRTEITMAAFERDGAVASTFKGDWLGESQEAEFQSGPWVIREIVSPGHGSWDIEWHYTFKTNAGKISGRGNKQVINDRKAYRGELKTFCKMSLEPTGTHKSSLVGKGLETDYKGRTSKANYEGWVSPGGRTFFLMSYDSSGLAALLVGRCSG